MLFCFRSHFWLQLRLAICLTLFSGGLVWLFLFACFGSQLCGWRTGFVVRCLDLHFICLGNHRCRLLICQKQDQLIEAVLARGALTICCLSHLDCLFCFFLLLLLSDRSWLLFKSLLLIRWGCLFGGLRLLDLILENAGFHGLQFGERRFLFLGFGSVSRDLIAWRFGLSGSLRVILYFDAALLSL